MAWKGVDNRANFHGYLSLCLLLTFGELIAPDGVKIGLELGALWEPAED